MNPATGPKSTSFKLTLAGIVSGLGTLITGLVQNPDALKNGASAVTDVRTAVGSLLVVGSVAAKLFHDNGFNKATIAAAGTDLMKELPSIKSDLGKAAGLVESDFPSLKSDFTDFETATTGKISELEGKITSLTGLTPQMVEDAVRHILASAQPVAPATPPTTPPAA